MPLNDWVDPVTVVADVLAEPGFPTPEDRIVADRVIRWIKLYSSEDPVILAPEAISEDLDTYQSRRTLTSDLMARRVVAALALDPATAGRKGTVWASGEPLI